MVVVTGSARYTVLAGGRALDRTGSTRALAAGYAATLARLRRTGARVVLLRDTPRPPFDVPDCVSGAMDALRRCAFPRAAALATAAAVEARAVRMPGVEAIDPVSRFCGRRLCPAVIGDVLVYRNSGHVTATYVKTMTPWLEPRLPDAARLGSRGG